MRSHILCLSIAVLILCGCSSRFTEQPYFKHNLVRMNTDYPTVELKLGNVTCYGPAVNDCIIKDSQVFAPSRGSHLFEISRLGNDSLTCFACRRGRAHNEMTSVLPVSEIFEIGADRYANLYSVPENKFFLWNIDESLRTGKDIYEKCTRLDTTVTNSLMSLWRVDESHIIAFNSFQDPYTMSVTDTPKYIQYDIESGQIYREYAVFNSVEYESSAIPSMALLSNVDCMSPDRGKIAFAMSYMPVISILDLNTEDVDGYVLPNTHRLDLNIQRWHFADIEANEQYIFALYSGEELYNESGTDIPKTLYVIDWHGRILLKAELDSRYTQIHLDGETMYFAAPDGRMASIPTSLIIDAIL